MPEVPFVLRWPDGTEQRCTSPSTIVHAHLATGLALPVGELVVRTAAALDAASERVREVYGFACTGAAAQQQAIARAAARFAPDDGPVVVVRVGAVAERAA